MADLKIVADSAIPFLKGVLEPYARIEYIKGTDISRDDVRDADVLIIRTRTRCNASLLEGSRVRLILTATIGFDHIDLPWCHTHGITVSTAAGCNARGVLQWFAAVMVHLSRTLGFRPEEKTVGVVGVGHVGSLIKSYAESWGFRVVCCDPPREEREHLGFLPLDEVARQADLLTFHVPYQEDTHHLCDARLLSLLRPDCIVMNSSRGAVVDNAALLADGHRAVLDVWEHEPDIDRTLVERVLLATPHIAGYSEQGKANATAISLATLSRHYQLPFGEWYPPTVSPSSPRPISWEELNATIASHYDIAEESRQLKAHPESFEPMRNNYPYRKEYF